MRQTIITIMLALVWVTGKAQNTGSALTNTYWRNGATGDWLIGFTQNHVIYDNMVWDIASQTERKDAYTLTLEGGTVIKVGKQKKGLRSVAISGRKPVKCGLITTSTLPDYPTKDTCTTFKDTHYQTDTVTLVGWLKDMPQEMKDKGNEFAAWVYDNIFSGDHRPNTYLGKMDSLGRFVMKIPMVNSAEVYLDLDRTNIATLFEPGETYFLLCDFKSSQNLFMGKNCRLQNELLAHQKEGVGAFAKDKMDEEAAMKFFEEVKASKEKAMNSLQQMIAEHPTVSGRYINYVKGSYNTSEGECLMNARFRMKNLRVPAHFLDYAGQQEWQQCVRPYTLYIQFNSFKGDYIDQLVSYRYREYLEDGRTFYTLHIEQLFAPVLRKYRDAGKITITDKELSVVDHYAKTREGVNEYADIISRKDINKIIFEDEEPLYDIYQTLNILDSIGCDQDLRDIIITQQLYFKSIKNADTLTASMMQFLGENVKMPAAKAFMLAQQEKLLALGRGDSSHAASLKSAEDVANMSDGEQILRKLIEPYKGKIILLDIWGTWCGPCKDNLSHSQEEYERLKDYDIVYLYLANNSSDEAWKDVIKMYDVTGDNVVHYNLPTEQQEAIERFLGVTGFPTYKLFDRDGNLLDMKVDVRNLEALARLLEKMK